MSCKVDQGEPAKQVNCLRSLRLASSKTQLKSRPVRAISPNIDWTGVLYIKAGVHLMFLEPLT